MTIEQKTANTMLQKAKPVIVAGKTYEAPPISGATLLLFSAEISKLKIESTDKEHFYKEILKNASHSKDIARALAILILGAKQIEAKHKLKNIFKRLFRKDDLNRLTDEIYYKMSIEEMSQLFFDLLQETQPTIFFSLIIFLNEVSVSKPTKNETTASGRSSEDS